MTQQSYTTTITVDQPPEAVFAAITNVRAWWSGEIDGTTGKLGDIFTYRYKDMHYSRQRVTEFVPGKRLAWQVVEAMLSFVSDQTEWAGTTITFDIAPSGGRTQLVFTHVGLRPAVECYDACSNAWSSLIQGSLKQLIETGRTERLALEGTAG